MLKIARNMRELSFGCLMEVYREGNRENAAQQWPEIPLEQGILLAEQDFYQYLREVLFTVPGAVCAIWEVDGGYKSALRLEPYRDGLLLAALETAPQHRRHGFAESLIREVQAVYQGTRIYSHVGKGNGTSLRLHEKCSFRRILEYAIYLDGSVNQKCCTLVYGP